MIGTIEIIGIIVMVCILTIYLWEKFSLMAYDSPSRFKFIYHSSTIIAFSFMIYSANYRGPLSVFLSSGIVLSLIIAKISISKPPQF